jgi:membrane protein YdbS with pleckstrin-like domain
MESTQYRVSGAWTLLSIAFWFLASVFASFTVVVPLIGFILIIRSVLLYTRTSVVLDDAGVGLKQGLLTIREKRFPLANIHSVSTSVGPIASQFDYGTIALSVGNDKNEIKINNLAGCQDLKERIESSRSKARA